MTKNAQPQTPWLPREVTEMRAMLRADRPWSVIAEALGRSVDSCKAKARDTGMTCNRPRRTAKAQTQSPDRPWAYGEEHELAALLSEGHEMGVIAESMGRSMQSVSNKAAMLARSAEAAAHASERKPWPTPRGMTRAQIAWAIDNTGDPQAALILGMARDPLLRRCPNKVWVARAAA